MNDESSKSRAVYAVAADGVSDSGHQLYTIHQKRVPNADNWKLFASQPAEQPRGEVIGWMLREPGGGVYIDECCIWLNREDAQEEADTLAEPDGDVYTPFPIVAGDTAKPKPEQDHSRDATKMIEQAVGDGVLSGKYGDVLRPFLTLMDRELHANAGKGDRPGWLAMDRKTALLEIFYHLAKLQKAAKDDDQDGIREYGADVANMAMMLVDVCGALDVTPRPAVATPATDKTVAHRWSELRNAVGVSEEPDESVVALMASVRIRRLESELAKIATPAEVTDETYTAEVVAEVVRGEDGGNKLSYVIEGGLDELEVGEVLYIIGGMAPPDDGAVDMYLAAQPSAVGVPFQTRVSAWMEQCFLPSLYSNMTERGDRLLEEVLELLQSKGYDRTRVATLVDYVYGRPAGEPSQEVGGVMVTLAGFCWIAGLDMHASGEAELSRINHPEVMAKIRAKQEAKNALHFDTPIPGAAADASAAEHGEVQS